MNWRVYLINLPCFFRTITFAKAERELSSRVSGTRFALLRSSFFPTHRFSFLLFFLLLLSSFFFRSNGQLFNEQSRTVSLFFFNVGSTSRARTERERGRLKTLELFPLALSHHNHVCGRVHVLQWNQWHIFTASHQSIPLCISGAAYEKRMWKRETSWTWGCETGLFIIL